MTCKGGMPIVIAHSAGMLSDSVFLNTSSDAGLPHPIFNHQRQMYRTARRQRCGHSHPACLCRKSRVTATLPRE